MVVLREPIVTRYAENPILTKDDFPIETGIRTVFNSGAIKIDDTYVMICRVENAALWNRLWIADSKDGIHFTPRPKPIQLPIDDPDFAEYTASMYYDPRITEIDGVYYIVHAAHSAHGCRLSLLKSVDFKRFEWMGFISETDNRNGVLFPEMIDGKYIRLDRPNPGGDIWISYSPDLIHWGHSKCVLKKEQVHWAWTKVGPGAVPIKTEEGWLNIFHGVRTQCAQHYVYQLGVALHDLNDPAKVIALAEEAILVPEESYELVGQTPSVVFTGGAVMEESGEIKIYYGGADTVQCLAYTTVDKLLAACHNRIEYTF